MVKIVVPALSALAAAVAFAAPAHADADGFLSDLHSAGIHNPVYGDEALLVAGHLMCDQLFAGVDPNALADDIYNRSATGMGSHGVSLVQAKMELVYAVADLCPGAAAIAAAH
jgi:hypothetical protein